MGKYSHINISDKNALLHSTPLTPPQKITKDSDWTLEALQEHLQWAVDIELFTIPFYMAAMYSIKDQSAEARRLLRSVVNQEMLHMQCAANIANAYGTDLVIRAPHYGGTIPHLNFALDTPNPEDIFTPFSTAIGPLDVERINAMCIIEYPSWSKFEGGNTDEYGSIGEFYRAVRRGAVFLAEDIQPNRNQVGHFTSIYPGVASMTITESGDAGIHQINTLIDLIVDQGEGEQMSRDFIPREFQNHVDDLQPEWDHFDKFSYLREQALPETYAINFGSDRGNETQELLLKNFGDFLLIMNKLFRGESPDDFAVVMYKVGAGIAACWENGALPVFSKNTVTGA